MLAIFSLFAVLLLLSAVVVILARNPVYSVFALVFAFVNVAGLLILLGAELIAMILLIVYVGAVAVFFLFVVMMLDIRVDAVKKLIPRNLLVLVLVALLIAIDVYALSSAADFIKNDLGQSLGSAAQARDNVKSLALVLYTDYFYAFQIVGVLLLAAMVGAIALTLDKGRRPRKVQSPFQQMSRDSTVVKVDLR